MGFSRGRPKRGYVLDKGTVPDSQERDANGRRRWTEAEVEAVVDAYRALSLRAGAVSV